MKAAALISHLQQLGIKLWIDGELLRYSAASGVMTPALRDELSKRKQEVLALLRRTTEAATLSGLPPLCPIARNQDLPLSFAQQRLWFLDQFESGGSAYNIPFAISLSGNLDAQALERSLQEIIRRHETLRTIFPTFEGKPVQRISPCEAFLLPKVDLRAIDPATKESRIQGLFREASERSVDLACGPLFQATLMLLSESEHLLLVTIHHIIADGWSLGVLVRELASLYEALVSGNPSPLQPLEIQYADFAVWQRGWLAGEVLDHELSYWRNKLAGAPSVLKLPTDRPRPAVQSFRGGTESIRFSEEVTAGLKRLSQHEKSTLFMTLMAAFQVLLHRYTGQEDLLVGTPMAGRNRVELEDLIGLFVNTVIVRTDLADNPTFRGLLARVRAASLEVYAHQDLPFERLVEELKPERSLSHTPLFQVMFSLENFPIQNLEVMGLKMSPLVIENETSKFDLSLTLMEDSGQLKGSFEYHRDLFDAATIRRMANHFQILLDGIARNPDEPISSLPLLSPTDKNQLIVEWNGTKSSHLENKCIHQLFEAQARKTPQAIALICRDRQLSYGELNSRANQVAHCLREMGVGPDVVVGICVERSLDMISGVLGILKAGGAYLPLDPAYPLERLAFMLRDAQAPVLLTQHRLSIKFLDFTGQTVCLDSGRDLVTKYSTENPEVGVWPENLSDLIYTSGSTGVPKGVLITHRSLANHGLSIARHYQLCSQDRVLQFASISFDVAAEELFPSLLCGATVIVRAESELGTIREFEEFSLRHGLTVVNLPAAYWQEWISELAASNRRLQPSLRLIIAGSESIAPSSLAQWKSLATGQVRWLNAYGPTEATITSTLWEPTNSGPEAIHTVPIGKPIDNLETYVLDSHSNLVPIGVSGELFLGGSALARGYLNHPDLTAEKFVPHPFSSLPGARLYRTGDVTRHLADGNLEFLGRTDDQVKLRGFRIELGEIESALNRYSEIREAVVLARDEESGDKRLVAYFALNNRTSFQLSELRAFLRQSLPEYMIPASYVEVAEITRTPAGKIDRRSLVESSAVFHDVAASHVAPRDSVEELISNIWSTLLGREQVGVYDNFFDLGGHSLLAIQLLFRIKDAFQVSLPARALFEAPTISQMAARVTEESQAANRHSHRAATPWVFLTPIQPVGAERPLYLVPGGIGGEVEFLVYARLARHLGLNQPLYGLKARGSDGKQKPHTQVSQMAADYILEIRAFQSEGPYMLAGECIGGVVAFEVAWQLRAQGQEVSLLALLDTACPRQTDYLKYCFEKLMIRWRKSNLARTLHHLTQLRRVPSRERLAYVREKYRKAKISFGSRLDPVANTGVEGREQLSALQSSSLLDHYFKTVIRYRPKTYPGRITLLVSEESYRSDPSMGWSRFAAGGLDIHPLPGDHQTYIREYVRAAATQLKNCLEKL